MYQVQLPGATIDEEKYVKQRQPLVTTRGLFCLLGIVMYKYQCLWQFNL